MKVKHIFLLFLIIVLNNCKKTDITDEKDLTEEETVNIMYVGDESYPVAGVVEQNTNYTDFNQETQVNIFTEHLVYDTTYREIVPSSEGGGYGVRFVLCYNDSTINGEYTNATLSSDSVKYMTYSAGGFLSSQQSVNYMFDDGTVTINRLSDSNYLLDFSFDGTDGRVFSGHYEGAFIRR